MSGLPSVLLLDDGELDDVHELLQELDVACARVRGGAIVAGTPAPKDLLIATPRRLDAVAKTIGTSASPPLRVVVADEDSSSLRAQLRRSGFDYLVRRPVHVEALRLLLMHCMYRGEERRRAQRVAVGTPVTFRTSVVSRRAMMIDLSLQGCRVLTRTRVSERKRIRVSVPKALDTGDPLSLVGRVVRCERFDRPGRRGWSLGIAFEELDASTHQALAVLIEDCSQGPATLPGDAADASGPEPAVPAQPKPAASAQPKRREVPERVGGPAAPEPTQAAAPKLEKTKQPTAAPTPVAPPTTTARLALPEPELAEPELPALQPDAPPASSALELDGSAPAAGPPASGRDRREHRRASYAQTIPAFGNRALRVLVGRDLSVGGMRIESQPELSLGDRLHLAIYGEAGEEPMLVWGRVARHDRERGHVILFEGVDEAIAERLERVVAALPSVESLRDSAPEAMGRVMTEIVAAEAGGRGTG